MKTYWRNYRKCEKQTILATCLAFLIFLTLIQLLGIRATLHPWAVAASPSRLQMSVSNHHHQVPSETTTIPIDDTITTTNSARSTQKPTPSSLNSNNNVDVEPVDEDYGLPPYNKMAVEDTLFERHMTIGQVCEQNQLASSSTEENIDAAVEILSKEPSTAHGFFVDELNEVLLCL